MGGLARQAAFGNQLAVDEDSVMALVEGKPGV
jgi:hypothetical protein